MSKTTKLRALTADDLGRTITVRLGDDSITGVLSFVQHRADMIENRRLMDLIPTYVVGRVYTTLAIGMWGEREYNPETECELA